MTTIIPDLRLSLPYLTASVMLASLLAALATLPLSAAFLTLVGPMFISVEPRTLGIWDVLSYGFQTSVIPIFVAILPVGLWALFVRTRFTRRLNWPFWLIIAWTLAGAASTVLAFRIESGDSMLRLIDMDFAPLHIRVALQAFLLFAKYSVMLVLVGGLFVTAIDRRLEHIQVD